MKAVFVAGGVSSSLGKGILSASLGRLLQARGYEVTIQKLDPYLNVDPGTLNPYEHGECYVTEDGAETDLDLGHYERFLGRPTSRLNNVTAGQVYLEVITREREGRYLGKTVQMIPHVTDEIKRRIRQLAEATQSEIIIVEIGGTVGDIESQIFLEAIRQLRWESGGGNTVFILLTLLPYLQGPGELKTKPTQHAVRMLLSAGIQPDIIACRTAYPLTPEIRKKLALFCNVQERAVIEAIDVSSIYEVPVQMLHEGLDQVVLEYLNLEVRHEPPLLEGWFDFLERVRNPQHEVRIGLVGKYVELRDAYISIREAFIHAGAYLNTHVHIDYIHSEEITPRNAEDKLAHLDGILVAPGFGERGIAGKIEAVRVARTLQIPFFGICLGMQCAVIEFARNVLGWREASSTEFDPETPYPVIDLMEEQKKIQHKGGTMRLGAYRCRLQPGSLAYEAYGQEVVLERHRHRWEFNNAYRAEMEAHGLRVTGVNPETGLVEIVELQDHPWFVGVQFHPEFKSMVQKPHPLFVAFVRAALRHRWRKSGRPSLTLQSPDVSYSASAQSSE